jgi:hypothetical protein
MYSVFVHGKGWQGFVKTTYVKVNKLTAILKILIYTNALYGCLQARTVAMSNGKQFLPLPVDPPHTPPTPRVNRQHTTIIAGCNAGLPFQRFLEITASSLWEFQHARAYLSTSQNCDAIWHSKNHDLGA